MSSQLENLNVYANPNLRWQICEINVEENVKEVTPLSGLYLTRDDAMKNIPPKNKPDRKFYTVTPVDTTPVKKGQPARPSAPRVHEKKNC